MERFRGRMRRRLLSLMSGMASPAFLIGRVACFQESVFHFEQRILLEVLFSSSLIIFRGWFVDLMGGCVVLGG